MSETRAHAILSASGASKWLNCPPSARLEAQFPDSTSEAADEGTLAHSLGELLIAHRRGNVSSKQYREALKPLQENKHYSKLLHEYADGYALYVLETFAAAQVHTPDAALFTEQRLDLRAYIPDGFGTGDAAVVADGVLDVIDLKYGKGVLVPAEGNPQLSIYALGWLESYSFMYDIKTVRLHIYQPRMNNISTHVWDAVELKDWGKKVVATVAEVAHLGNGYATAGSWCKFCKAKKVCKVYAEMAVSVVADDFAEFVATEPQVPVNMAAAVPLMTDEEIASVLSKAEAFKEWLNTVQEYALTEALAGRRKWPGYKLVTGRSVRKITDESAAEKVLIKNGYDRTKLYKPQQLVGVTDIEKLTGKAEFDRLLGELVQKVPGKPTLAEQSDKRAEYDPTGGGDFSDLTTE